MEAQEAFRIYLRQHALRFTPQRRAVLEEVYATHRHFDAEELFERLRAKQRNVSRATVYRTLSHLVECNLIKEVLRCRGRAQYEHTLGHSHHDHLLCVECGKVIEFHDPTIEESQRRICEAFRFEPIEHRLGIRGICWACQKKKKGRRTHAYNC